MAHQETKRCKGCNAPLLSALERDQGNCTACLRAKRTRESKVNEPSKNKRKPDPVNVNVVASSVLTHVNAQQQANSVMVGTRISLATHTKAQAIIKRNAQTLSGWLRGLIEREVYQDQDNR